MAVRAKKTQDKKRINLALQGGGAHGAFTWGVLLRLLEDDNLEIAAISGTSAGALNGAALKAGLACGEAADPRAKARDNLNWLWGEVGAVSDLRLSAWIDFFGPFINFMRETYNASPAALIPEAAGAFFSPYFYGPAYVNPLERIVDQLNFGNICAHRGPEFFVCTTRIRDGKVRVFEHEEISTDTILASACLPTVFQAVKIYDRQTERDEYFYDGGFTGNPALFPMFRPEFPEDMVIVNINPLERDELPTSPQAIAHRVNEISFNSSLLRELRAISFVHRLIEEGRMEPGAMRDIKVHMIADDELMTSLSAATKLTPAPYLLAKLRDAGYAAADRFMEDHRADLNVRPSVDIVEMFS